MKKFLPLIAALCLACSAGLTHAAEGKHLTPQQQKMSTCSKQAKADGKKGAERKAFMKECLSSKHAAAPAAAPAAEAAPTAKATQQEKMKACNKEATGKKGADRKAFMKECLSK